VTDFLNIAMLSYSKKYINLFDRQKDYWRLKILQLRVVLYFNFLKLSVKNEGSRSNVSPYHCGNFCILSIGRDSLND
jgi:hypothetical protein